MLRPLLLAVTALALGGAAVKLVAPAGPPAAPAKPAGPTLITIDAAAGRRPISPLIYGVSFATTETLLDLNLPLNRSGGDNSSLYNWRIDARNAGSDWFFESIAAAADVYGQHGDGFVTLSHAGEAAAMISVPMTGWAAKLGPNRERIASFSITKYGLQQKTDVDGMAEAGNGVDLDGHPITKNDPLDAAMPVTIDDQREWVKTLVAKWGPAAKGGIAYWLMDNEPSRWHDIHRDVRPIGAHASEIEASVRAYSAMVKAIDPTAQIVAPEEWGWPGYHDSGFDQQQAELGRPDRPDRATETGGMDYLPWLLTRWKAAGRPVDVVSVHFYPQGGEYRDAADFSPKMQQLRNRSTRLLWDPAYQDTSWINAKVALIPRLRQWVDRFYWPGTPIGLTEYNWGGETGMNGATTQADILGIFGREGLDMANYWTAPKPGTPTYLAFKLFRNYDDNRSAFGDISVATSAPDADTVSAFSALRAKDRAMTIVVINKQADKAAPVALSLANFAPAGSVETVRLVGGKLARLPGRAYRGGRLATVLPAQSVTLFVLRGAGRVQ